MRRAFTLQLYAKPAFGDSQGLYPSLQFSCPAPHCNVKHMRVHSTRNEDFSAVHGLKMSYEASCDVCETTATFVGHAANPPDPPQFVLCADYNITKGPTPLSSIVGSLFGKERYLGESDAAYRQRILDSLQVAPAGAPAKPVDERTDDQRRRPFDIIKKGSF